MSPTLLSSKRCNENVINVHDQRNVNGFISIDLENIYSKELLNVFLTSKSATKFIFSLKKLPVAT